MAQDGLCGGSGVACERVLEGGEVRVLEVHEEPVAEGRVDVTTLVVL